MQLLSTLILLLVIPQLAIAQPPASYPLTIQVSPPDSKVMIKNIKAKYKLGMMLAPGKYNVIVSHPQYGKQQQWVEIKDTAVTVQVVLDKPATQQLPQSVAFTPSVVPTPIKPPKPVSVTTAPTKPPAVVVTTPNNATIALPKPATNNVAAPVHSNTEIDWLHILLLYPLMFAIVGTILYLFTYSLRHLLQHGEVLIWPNLPQPVLFCLIYFLIYQIDPQNYQFNRPPQWWDWVQFTGAHILRAGDILDVIEEYKWDLQNVKHASNLVASTVMAMHWIMDILLIGLLWQWVGHWWEKTVERWKKQKGVLRRWYLFYKYEAGELFVRIFLISLLSTSLVFFLTLGMQAIYQGRSFSWFLLNGLVLWPLDNVIRVVDVGDSLQLYNLVLHDATVTMWTGTLAVAFRLFVSLPIGQAINWLHLQYLRGLGKTADDLVQDLKDTDTQPATIAALVKLGKSAIPNLIRAIEGNNFVLQNAAITILGEIGSDAKHTIPVLIKKYITRKNNDQLIIDDALRKIDPQWEKNDIR